MPTDDVKRGRGRPLKHLQTGDPTTKKNLTLDEESILALQDVQHRLTGEFGFAPTHKQTVLYLINLYRQQPRR